ncbi:ABC transporter substrate-binding protein [Alteromonas mediterranea]|uniref:FtsX-like permease family protein n=1 Tax=Alteromonas mediterranea TaxID=314275 RepID=UPI00090339D6|nr:FtsX-like permease family protein [Alteromonas mediterranea]APD93814.1 ABC transporter substrate-binding protein [Alteromonas mediterranea]APD97440.1 ABC transporter substrate-binding protein [Alteromonas mediterranea]
MFYPVSAFIAYRYAKSSKSSQTSFVSFINRFSVAGIALGLMALIIVVSVMNGLEGQLKQRVLGIVPHIEITKTPTTTSNEITKTPTTTSKDATLTKTPIVNKQTQKLTETPTTPGNLSETPTSTVSKPTISEDDGSKLTKTPTVSPQSQSAMTLDALSKTPIKGVVASMAYRETEAVVQSRSDLRGVQVHGVEPVVMLEHTLVANHMEQGRFNDLVEGSFSAIIGRALAIKLDARVGDRLRVMVAGASVYTPLGRMPSQRLVTIVGVFDMGSQMDDKVMYMNLKDVNRLMRDPKGDGQSLRLFLNDAFNYLAVVDHLTDTMGVSVSNIRTWRERQGPLFDAVKMEKNMMTLMLLLIIAVAAFNIVSALVMVVTEKQGDIAVLQTQGMLPGTVMWIFVLNGLFNGIKGAGIGLILGVVITLQLNNILDLIGSPLALAADGSGLPVEMDAIQIAGIALLSLLLCVLASVYPARKAMKIAPSQALQNE